MSSLSATTLALGPDWLNPEKLITSLGPWVLVGICAIIFAETGLLLGFFLPGDSLLFTAGLFLATGVIDYPLWLVCTLVVISAVMGNVVGYWIGRAVGPPIFNRPNSRWLRHEHVERTQAFFDKYGARAVVLGRFVPIVRTFITVMAGVGRMDPRRYFTYSIIGGIAWAAGVTLLGVWLGRFDLVRNNIELMLMAIVLVSVLPILFEFLRSRRSARTTGPVR